MQSNAAQCNLMQLNAAQCIRMQLNTQGKRYCCLFRKMIKVI